jgi:endonuclease/exonuclease/phosphatase (EEP) superfamily protein YafD
MWSTNSARNKQIAKILADIQNGSINPVLITGDFNYPYGRKKFEHLINKFGLKEATNNIFYTFEMKLLGFIPVKWKNDYILYRHIKCLETKRIKVRSSDHYPIISTFEI